jgi:hypothetical protein
LKITRDEAEAYFSDPSQRKAAMLDGPLPDFCTYYAQDGVCMAFHLGPWPGLLIGHIGTKRPGVDAAALAILRHVWAEEQPDRIAGWIKESNRAARAMCLRLGMELDGRLPLAEPVLVFGWRA